MSNLKSQSSSYLDLEQALLGSILIDPSSVDDVSEIVHLSDFRADPWHSHIFHAMCKLHEYGKPIDFLTLSYQLKEQHVWDITKGDAYLVDLINAVPTSVNAANYASLLRRANGTEFAPDEELVKERLRRLVYIQNDTVVLNVRYEYVIELDRCSTPELILKWVRHLSRKTWTTTEIMQRFIDVVCSHHGIQIPE